MLDCADIGFLLDELPLPGPDRVGRIVGIDLNKPRIGAACQRRSPRPRPRRGSPSSGSPTRSGT
jgi:hypothetical protein